MALVPDREDSARSAFNQAVNKEVAEKKRKKAEANPSKSKKMKK